MKKKLGIFLFILVIITILSFVIINFINTKITPIVMNYSISEMKRIVSTIINRSISSDLIENDINELFITTKNKNEDIITVTLDSKIVNIINDKISDACEDNLRLIEEGKYDKIKEKFNIGKEYFLVPSGIIFNNPLFSNLGPKIPITLKVLGNVNSGVTSEVKDYGINNSLITISIEIKVELMVILPISSEFVEITNYIPIAIKLIQGKVPEIYGGNLIN